MAGIADQFAGLPIEDLIVSPIVGMAIHRLLVWQKVKQN